MNDCFKKNRFLIEGMIQNPVKIHCDNGDILDIKWSADKKTKYMELNIVSKYREVLVYTEGANYRLTESILSRRNANGWDYHRVYDQYKNLLGFIRDIKIHDAENKLVARARHSLVKMERRYLTPARDEIAYSEAVELLADRYLYFRSVVSEDNPIRLLVLVEFIFSMMPMSGMSKKGKSFRRPGSGINFE